MPGFWADHGHREWKIGDADRRAAHAFHVQLISRVSTQRLGYGRGIEAAALRSLHKLFEKAREVVEANPGSATVEILVWEVMNAEVRPFASKWHPRSVEGGLQAIDTSDEFREELEHVQRSLRRLDAALRLVLGSAGYRANDPVGTTAEIEAELAAPVTWRPAGHEVARSSFEALALAEARAVRARRTHYGLADRGWASGIALSGGGIRSATFSMGVLAALARRDLLQQFDYLSSVSGGGYTSSFLTQLLGAAPAPDLGLRPSERPFRRAEGESEILRTLRQRARFLAGSFLERVFVAMRQVHGLFVNLVLLLLAVAVFAYADASARRLVIGSVSSAAFAIGAPLLAVVVLACAGKSLDKVGTNPGWKHILLGGLFVVPPAWYVLGLVHEASDAAAARLPGGLSDKSLILGRRLRGFGDCGQRGTLDSLRAHAAVGRHRAHGKPRPRSRNGARAPILED
ncbi:patatin-like phospholipase family protein [Methylobacterium tarhaniae]|uniref:patatin-like phospholipase family protein n=1 Tax=Methylobacterium tarhaniae TaxID=1187852 RepID=UPI000A97F70C|nr:patatin-like phospholipase family protein [Methylobacterium tarhaniae]